MQAPLEEGFLGNGGAGAPNRRTGLKVSVLVAAALLFLGGIFLLTPESRDMQKLKKPTQGPLTVQEAMVRFPRPDNVHELNAFFALLPAHDDHAQVFNHVAPHVKLVYNTFLKRFGTTAPHWKTKERSRRHQLDGTAEFDYRLDVFTEMLQKIIKQNAFEATVNTNPNRAVFGVTKFADWTWAEFQTMLRPPRAPENTTTTGRRLSGTSPPCNKNWAAENRDLFFARSQGQCGSCYAHAAAEELRAMAFINAGFDPGELSVQYIVDCKGNGCDGGDASNVMDWVSQQGGIPSKIDYGPYQDGAGSCKTGIPFSVTTSGASRHRYEDDTANTICSVGPTSMGVYVNDAFQSYTHGVLSHHSCPSKSNNHDTQAVAVLMDQGAWLIRNSWGSDWGIDPETLRPGERAGFIMLEYGYNTCGLEQLNGIPENVVQASGCTGGASPPCVAATTPPPNSQDTFCDDTCIYDGDGACDDGGDGSSYSMCTYGSDCGDCGSRSAETGCTNTCEWAQDGECDEGDENSQGLCALGTDCTDCGDPAHDPCASCQTSNSALPCVLSQDGTCSTQDDSYYCTDSNDNFPVYWCGDPSVDPCASCHSRHSELPCMLSTDGTCSTQDDAYYCLDTDDQFPVSSC